MLFLEISLAFYKAVYTLKPDWYSTVISGLSPENTLISILLNGSYILAIMLLFRVEPQNAHDGEIGRSCY